MTFRLLLGYDGTNVVRGALEYVAPLARDPGVQVTVLTVGRNPAICAARQQAVTRLCAPVAVEHIAVPGALERRLREAAEAQPYDLVASGWQVRGRTRLARWRSRKHLNAALPTSVLLVQGSAKRLTRALICSAGDQTVVEDARLTGHLAQIAGARTTVLHVLSQVPLAAGRSASPERVMEVLAAAGAPELGHMQRAVGELSAVGVEASLKIRIGPVVDEIVSELIDGAYDMLVIGAHRSRGLVERLLLQDVASAILAYSPVPVLVVKAPSGATLPG